MWMLSPPFQAAQRDLCRRAAGIDPQVLARDHRGGNNAIEPRKTLVGNQLKTLLRQPVLRADRHIGVEMKDIVKPSPRAEVLLGWRVSAIAQLTHRDRQSTGPAPHPPEGGIRELSARPVPRASKQKPRREPGRFVGGAEA